MTTNGHMQESLVRPWRRDRALQKVKALSARAFLGRQVPAAIPMHPQCHGSKHSGLRRLHLSRLLPLAISGCSARAPCSATAARRPWAKSISLSQAVTQAEPGFLSINIMLAYHDMCLCLGTVCV